MLTRGGIEVPFEPKKDDRFMLMTTKFYNDLVQMVVATAKDEARKACFLVMQALDRTLEDTGGSLVAQLETEHELLVTASQSLQTHLEGYLLDHASIKYYYYTAGVNKDRQGPASFDELVQLFKTEAVHMETFVWHKLLGDKWTELKHNGYASVSLKSVYT